MFEQTLQDQPKRKSFACIFLLNNNKKGIPFQLKMCIFFHREASSSKTPLPRQTARHVVGSYSENQRGRHHKQRKARQCGTQFVRSEERLDL